MLLQDVRFALRLTRRTPVMSLTAVLALAVAFGLATAGFTALRGIFFATLPGSHGDRIVAIEDYNRTGGWTVPLDLTELERRQRETASLDGIGAYHLRAVSAGDNPRTIVLRAAFVTPNTFDLLGVPARIGRTLQPADAEPGAPAVVVLAESQFGRLFGADQSAVGQRIRIDGAVREVVGLIGDECRFPDRTDLWLPLATSASGNPAFTTVALFGRLRQGVSASESAAEMGVIASRNPNRLKGVELISRVEPFARAYAGPEQRAVAIAGVAGLGILVLIFAASVANLMLVRTAARRRELTVRLALGASRGRLIAQVAIEALMLTALAAAAGVVVASWSLDWIAHRFGHPPYWVDLSLRPATVGVVLLLTLATTLVAGVGPAIRVVTSIQGSIREGLGRLRFGRVTGAVIVAELALAVGLLGGATLIGRGLLAFGYGGYTFPAENLVVAQLYFGRPQALATAGATLSEEDRGRIWREFERQADAAQRIVIADLERKPGVMVSRAMHFPGNDTPNARVDIDAADGTVSIASRLVEIDDRFLATLDAAPITGRNFRPAEIANGAKVAMVNLPFARRHFGEGAAIGRRVRPAGTRDWHEIVGVVPDLALNPGAPASDDGIYVPWEPGTVARLGIRTNDPARVEHDLHEAALAPGLRPQVQWVITLKEQMATAETIFRVFGSLLLVAGGGAFLLACAGIYAIVAFDVTERRREIAIRIAVGAGRRDIVRSVAGRTLVQLGVGVAIGTVLAVVVQRVIGSLPITVESSDPWLLGATTLLLACSGLAACAPPLAVALGTKPAEWLKDV